MFNRSIGGTVVGVVIGICVVAYQFHSKDKTDQDYRQYLHEFVAACDCYEKNQAYLDKLCDEAHDKAFAHAYHMGGRRTATRFDEDKYINEAMTFIVERAKREGHKDIVASLERLQNDEPEPAKK